MASSGGKRMVCEFARPPRGTVRVILALRQGFNGIAATMNRP